MTLSIALSIGLACATAAPAQQVMLSGTAGSAVIDLSNGATRWTSPQNLAFYGGLVSPDGRYSVAVELPGAGSLVRVTDMATGANFSVPASFEPRAAHPRTLTFFGLSGGPLSFGYMQRGTLARLDTGGLSLLGGCPPLQTIALDLSGDGNRLFAMCESGQIFMIDTATGVTTATPLSPGQASFKSNYDGTALLIAWNAGMPIVELIDIATTTLLKSTGPISASGVVISHISPDRRKAIIDRVFFGTPLPRRQSAVLDLDTFAFDVTLVGIDLQIASISPDNRTMYSSQFPRFGPGTIQTHDLATGAITASAGNFAGTLIVSHPPLPPVAAVTVSGSRVDLSWTMQRGSPVATAHTLEIGSTPGQTNLGTVVLGPESSLSVPGVPAGRYYVRVRARNVAGTGAASNELVIDVP